MIEIRKNINSADYIRAFASLIVVIYHLGGKTQPILNYGWLGVQMFFVLSGFIISYTLPKDYNYKQSLTFIIKRVVRINFPYFFSILLIIFINFLARNINATDWQNVGLHLLYLNQYFDKPYLNPVYWTLAIEFQFYLLIALFFPIINKNIGLIVLCLANMIIVMFKVEFIAILNFLPLFSLGILGFRFTAEEKKLHPHLICSILIIAICSILNLGWLQSITGFLTFAFLFAPLPKLNVITFFSKISFSLYLVHDVVGSRLVVYLGKYFPPALYYKAIIFLVGLAVSIITAWIFYKLIEKPFIKLSKSIKYSPKNYAIN